MKKLLVVLMAAIMVLSMAAVSMAAATVTGDWRGEWQQLDSANDGDLDFLKYDLRLNFDGTVSDTVSAHLQMTYDNSVKTTIPAADGELHDGKATKDIDVVYGVAIKEYWVNFKQSWGTVKAGYWDAKFIPSRVLLKPQGVNCMNNKTMQILIDVPFGDAFYGGLLFDPSLAKDDMEYDVKLGYKADSFGVEFHYADYTPAAEDGTYMAIDGFYNVSDSIKVFAYAIQAVESKNGNGGLQKWEEELAPVIGATFKNIGGSKLTASLEYGLCDGDMDDTFDFVPYAVQLKYGFNNKVNLEVEYTNELNPAKTDTEGKLIIRPRVAF